MPTTAEKAVDLLTVDVEAVKQVASAEVITEQRRAMEGLSTDELFAEAAKVEEALQKAVAALEAKKAGGGGSGSGAARDKVGPIALFEGTPIDCGAVAACAVAAAYGAMDGAALEALIAQTEVELSKAKAALERKKAGRGAGGGGGGGSGGSSSSSARAANPAPSTTSKPAPAPSTPSKPPPATPSRSSSLLDAATEKLTPLITKTSSILEDTKEVLKSPKAPVYAGLAVAALGIGAAFVGMFGKSRR